MKYLKGRERFLSEVKQLNQKQINEAFDMGGDAGPFSNDIAWGDSLVGRLINFVIRKIGVGVNMVRIQPVITRLKLEFQNLLTQSQSAAIEEEKTRKNIAMLLICEQITVIHEAIVNMKAPGTNDTDEGFEIEDTAKKLSDIKPEEYLKECEEVVDQVTQSIGAISDEFGEIDNYNELVETLKDLSEIIKVMKAEVEEKKTGDKAEEKEEVKDNSIDIYLENFKTVASMILEYDAMKKQQATEFKAKGATPTGEKGGLTPATTGDAKTGTPAEKEVGSMTMDSYSFISEAVTSPIFQPLKKLYDTLKQISPEDLVTDMQEFLKMSPENQKMEKNSRPISNIYKYIRLKSGIKESLLIKEDLNLILSKDKVLGDAIMGIYAVSKTKPDGSFEGITPKLKENLAKFNQTMSLCLKPSQKSGEAKTETSEKDAIGSKVSDSYSNRNLLLKYNDFKSQQVNESEFISNVNESALGEFLGKTWAKIKQLFTGDEDIPENENPAKVDDADKLKISKNNDQKILSLYWTEIYTSRISKIVLTNEEYKKLKTELVKIKYEPGESKDGIIIDGMDPIIGILKCFNRAYKLYTVAVIPGGRSRGAVDRATYAEYDSFGGSSGGDLSAYNGPFRHKKTYNMWENAVLDIMRDREFQPIFNAGTKLRVGNVLKPGAGTALREFMTDIMDGETLYKSKEGYGKDSGGAQKQLLEKYFGKEAIEEVKEGDTAFGGTQEIKDNTKLESEIKKSSVEFKEGNAAASIEKSEMLSRMIFELSVEMTKPADYKEEDKDKNKEIDAKRRYFFPIALEGDMLYVAYSRKFGAFAKYIQNDYSLRDKKMSVSFNPSDLRTQQEGDLFLTKIKVADFKKMLVVNNKIKLTGQPYGTTDKRDIGEQTTKGVQFLYTAEDGDKPKIYNLEKYSTSDTKGFKESELKAHSPQSQSS